jgi:prepilin-type N-terminal cleavage/methylation domain-containing protein
MHKSRGFTLIEVLIVVTLLGIIAAVIYGSFNRGTAQSRDTQRMADLRNLQNAIELYKQEKGRYPLGCNSPGWSGQSGADYACSSGNQYILDLAPKYIRTLPKDPKLNGNNSGYAYLVNADGTVYKLVAYRTVEALSVVEGDNIVQELTKFQFCPADGKITNPSVLCVQPHTGTPWSGNTPNHCRYNHADGDFRTSYALWGGYANAADNPVWLDSQIKRWTEMVVCQKP